MALRAAIVFVAAAALALGSPAGVSASGMAPETTISFRSAHPQVSKAVYFSSYVDDTQDCSIECWPPWDADLSQYYQWDFDNDGIYNELGDDDIGLSAGGTLQAPVHTFEGPGPKIVNFRGRDVDDGLYGTSTTTVDVHAANWPPTGDFRLLTDIGYGCTSTSCDFTARSGREARFEAFGEDPDTVSASSSACGPIGEVISRDSEHFAWDFNGDGVYNGPGDEYSGTPDYPMHTWPASDSPQSYLVSLLLKDSDGGQTQVAHTVFVAASATNLAPNVTVGASPSSPTSTGTEVRFSLTAWDHDGSIPQDADHIAWDFNDDGVYGDAYSGNGTGTLTYARHVFENPGDQTVRARVTDSDGRAATAAVTVHVARPSTAPASPRISAPYAAVVGQPVTVSGRSYSGATYSWDLNGDGVFGDSTARDPSWTYGNAGDVLIRVQITLQGTAPAADRTGEAATILHVDTFNPPPRAYFSMSHETSSTCGVASFRGLTGKPLAFASNTTDPDTNAMSTPSWDWHGDGTFGDDLGGGWEFSPIHTFADPGNRLVLMRATDALGATTVTGHSIALHDANEPPTASMSPNASYMYIGAGQPNTFAVWNATDDSAVAAYAWDLDDDGAFDDGSSQSVTYTFTTAGTHTIRARVTDDDGASFVDTESVNVRAVPPVNQTPPAITGQPTTGQTVTASTGTWSGTPPITYGYQWQRCDAGVIDCVNVDGATAATYELTAADIGSRIRVGVTADNSAAGIAGPVWSAATLAVGVPLASNDDATITGGSDPPRAGETLTANPGTWTRDAAFSFQWQRCEADGTGCIDIGGATDASHVLVALDVGKRIRVLITGTLGSESDTTTAGPSGIVQPSPPAYTDGPSIAGVPRDGETLTASPGTWTGSPTFAYAWERCSGSACSPVARAAGMSYELTAGDVGAEIRLVVTATNEFGSVPATSPKTGVVQAVPAALNQAPAVTGKARDGQVLAGTAATFTGTTPISITSTWQRCNADASDCAAVSGATELEYEVGPADVGKRLRLHTSGSNAALPGGATATGDSAATEVVQALPAHYVSGVRIMGAATPLVDRGTLDAETGFWTGSAPIVYGYSWQRCDAAGANCVTATAFALNSNYELSGLDAGHTLRVVVHGSNTDLPGGGSDQGVSAASAVVQGSVAQPPVTPNLPPTLPPPPTVQTPPVQPPPATPASGDVARANLGAVAKSLTRLRLARLVKTGQFRVTVSIPAAARVKVDLLLGKSKVVARGAKPLGAAGKHQLVVKLTKAGKAALSKMRKARLTVRITVATGATSGAASRVVVLKR